MEFMSAWITFILSSLADFLMEEPICYFTGLMLLTIIVRLTMNILYRREV